MSQGDYGNNSYRTNISKLRMAVTAELIQAARDVRLIDELFQWLSPTIERRFDVQVVQIWVAQIDYQGQCFMKLQALSSQKDSLPHRLALNKPFADLAGEIRSWQTELALSHIGNVFTPFQATLLQRYGLNYCFAEYLTGKGQSPSSSNPAGQGTLKPMEAVALLFFNQPPHLEIQKSISYVLRLAIQLAETNVMLLPPAGAQSNVPGYRLQLQQERSSALLELVPHRTEDTDLMTTSSPLSDSIVISNKKARRLYSAIDGRNNVMELCHNTRLDLEEITMALQLLLAGRHVLLCDSSGQVVESSQYLNNL